jgi:hypothetical protein
MLYVFAGMRAGCFSRCLPQPANLDIGLFVLLEYTPSAFDVSFLFCFMVSGQQSTRDT